MKPVYIILIILAYFVVLSIISYVTGRSDSNKAFFKGENESPWYVVAFGMVGASLSGVTFISVPGWVRDSQFGYMQVVFGFTLGYLVVAFILLPIYYRLNVISIYEYLLQRFGKQSYFTGAFFFFVSRIIGGAFRLFLVAKVLHHFVFDFWGVPFVVTVVISVLFIWLYTARGGIKTIVWTDVLQTFFMICAVIITVIYVSNELGWGVKDFFTAEEMKPYTKMIFTEEVLGRSYFWKSLIGGVFITIAMTGLDQDMMQKNLTCKNLKEAQKNVLSYSLLFIPINLVFLLLGALLYVYAARTGISVSASSDLLYPEIALGGDLGAGLSVVFLLGLIAAAYSSADSVLAALTTSFCIDFLNIKKYSSSKQKSLRKQVHLGISALLVVVIFAFNYLFDQSVIDLLYTAASYTYGPLLGLFAFGIFTKKQIRDRWVLVIALLSVGVTAILGNLPPEYLGGYHFNYELLVVNGVLTFLGLILISRK